MFRFHDNAAGIPLVPRCGCRRLAWTTSAGWPDPILFPRLPPPSTQTCQKATPISVPCPSPPVCLHGPSVSPPCPPTPPLQRLLPLPPSCLQRDSGLFVGFPFPKSCQLHGPPPCPHRAPPFSLPPSGIQGAGFGVSSWKRRLKEETRLLPFIPWSPLLCRAGHTPYKHPL